MVPTFEFTGELWEHSSMPGSWYFVTLPEDCADDIAAITEGAERRGFGSVRVEATIGPSTWRTSVFPDKASGSYVLPVKKAVRAAAALEAGDAVAVHLAVLLP